MNTSVIYRLDYYPFGSVMDGREIVLENKYRFGYQGSEKDFDVAQDNYTTHYRMLDTRLGRWFSTDPVFQPWQSTYNSMDNNPIWFNDVNGDEITLSGENINGFMNKLNNESSLQFKLNDKNQIVLQNPDAKAVGFFQEFMVEAINNSQDIPFKLVGESSEIFFDVFSTAEVDVEDFNRLDGEIYKSSIMHVIEERFFDKRYKEKVANPNFSIPLDYKKAHVAAFQKEAEYFKSVFPSEKENIFAPQSFEEISEYEINIEGTLFNTTNFGSVEKLFFIPEYDVNSVVPCESSINSCIDE